MLFLCIDLNEHNCIELNFFFAKHVFPSVTLLAKLIQTFTHFRLRLCFLVVVPFNLNCKQQKQ